MEEGNRLLYVLIVRERSESMSAGMNGPKGGCVSESFLLNGALRRTGVWIIMHGSFFPSNLNCGG